MITILTDQDLTLEARGFKINDITHYHILQIHEITQKASLLILIKDNKIRVLKDRYNIRTKQDQIFHPAALELLIQEHLERICRYDSDTNERELFCQILKDERDNELQNPNK